MLTPQSFRLRVVDSPRALATGAVLELQLSWLGVPVRWRAFVREWDPLFRFVDVQVRGPYARWEHRHRFFPGGGRRGTWVEDRVTYRLPLGLLRRTAHALLVRRQFAAMWRYRTPQLGELVGTVSSPGG